jgi:hypothetical protein
MSTFAAAKCLIRDAVQVAPFYSVPSWGILGRLRGIALPTEELAKNEIVNRIQDRIVNFFVSVQSIPVCLPDNFEQFHCVKVLRLFNVVPLVESRPIKRTAGTSQIVNLAPMLKPAMHTASRVAANDATPAISLVLIGKVGINQPTRVHQALAWFNSALIHIRSLALSRFIDRLPPMVAVGIGRAAGDKLPQVPAVLNQRE